MPSYCQPHPMTYVKHPPAYHIPPRPPAQIYMHPVNPFLTNKIQPGQQLNTGIGNMQAYRYAAQHGQHFTNPHYRQYTQPEVRLHHNQVNQVNTSLDSNTSVHIPNASNIVKAGVIRSEKKSVDVEPEVIIHDNQRSENIESLEKNAGSHVQNAIEVDQIGVISHKIPIDNVETLNKVLPEQEKSVQRDMIQKSGIKQSVSNSQNGQGEIISIEAEIQGNDTDIFRGSSVHQKTTRTVTDRRNSYESGLKLATCNIEGITFNSALAYFLNSNFDIVCIQEHWPHDFQAHNFDKFFENKASFVRCSDSYEQISGFNLPRGKGGVGFAWSSSITGKVTKMDEGNERIIGIVINSNPKICVICCVYLPTNNTSVHLIVDYNECLDILDHIINKYSATYKIVIAGDFNGTLLDPRVSNKHDVSIQAFVRDHKLLVPLSKKPTFIHHSGASSSQIDYIFSTHEDVILDYFIPEKHATNLSSHNIVTAVVDTNIASKLKNKVISPLKYQWDKTDILIFRDTLQLELGNCNVEVYSESNLAFLKTIL
ncbi:unnamed protein product [Mytilus coruscus]|uniref:Endonuclease/exonuclease/phosphatase domain-containing protein n=1 Tax=Mytilus coruscus TaxID=42192 RepID=A0A6J8DQD5_MYTCO|nr:unnamed protein product [Mytilus coruscus]